MAILTRSFFSTSQVRFFCSSTSRLKVPQNSVLDRSQVLSHLGHKTVHNYDPSIDAKAVHEIALANITRLVSPDIVLSKPPEDRDQQLFESDIRPALESSHVNIKVLRCENETVGFITYHVKKGWFRTYAKIEHLAISKMHQNKGYGTVLLEHALGDVKDKKADFVHLDITTDDLFGFYKKYGFEVIKHENAKYGTNATLLGRNLRPQPSFRADQCLDYMFMRKRIMRSYMLGLAVLGIILVVID